MIKSRRMKKVGDVARMGKRKAVYGILVGKPEGKRPLAIHRHRRGIILKWVLRKCNGGLDWINRAQNRNG